MRYLAIAGVAMAAVNVPAQADNGQAGFKAYLEGMRPPVFVSGKTVPDVTAAYSLRGEGCTSFIDIMIPSALFEGKAHPSSVITETVDWGSVTNTEISGSYIIVSAPGLVENGKRHLFSGSPAGAQTMKALIDRIVVACSGHTPAISQSSAQLASRLADRVAIVSPARGAVACAFPAVPGLTITRSTPSSLPWASFRAPAQEGGRDARFTFGVDSAKVEPGWHGLLAMDPRFHLVSDRIGANKIVRAEVTLDSAAFSVPITILHERGIGKPWSSFVTLAPTYFADQDQWFARLERGSQAVVVLYDQNNARFGPWTFDVSDVRNVPAALQGSNFRCE